MAGTSSTSAGNSSGMEITQHKQSRKEKYLDRNHVAADLRQKCKCGEDCLSKIDIETAHLWRSRLFQCKEGSARQVKIIELMQSMQLTVDFNTFIINSEVYCRHAWLQILRISESSFYRALKLLGDGKLHNPCNIGNNGKGSRGQEAVGFMDNYVKMMGDICPTTGRTFLPCCTDIGDVYDVYCQHYYNQEQQITRTRFKQLWKEYYSHVSFPKITRMTKCNVCILAKDLVSKTSDPQTRKMLVKERDEHLKRQWGERNAYYKRKAEASSNSEGIISVIVDGMDQAKTYLPHFKGWSNPKDCDKYRLQPHIEGCLVHGRTFYAYLVLEDSHDSNMVINTLMKALVKESAGRPLPSTLYLQQDNCWRENKNRFFIGFMAYLVAMHIFNEVQMSFLMVGHTHEDIDQRFSCISRSLKHRDARTLPELQRVIVDSMPKMSVKALRLGQVFDIKTWLEPYLNPISQHSAQHAFRLTRSKDGPVLLHYKQWNQDPDWLPLANEDQIPVFISDEDGKMKLPPGNPNLRQATFEKQSLEMVKRTISNAKHHLTDAEHVSWWSNFFENPLNDAPANDWFLTKLARQAHSQPDGPGEVTGELDLAPTLLTPFLEKERHTIRIIHKRNSRSKTIQVALTLQAGKMVLTKSKGVGQIVGITDDEISLSVYQGKKHTIWRPLLRPNGSSKQKVVNREDISKTFDLTPGMRLPGNIVTAMDEL
ncbi:uncharacterized protein LOC135153857 [Lytechinus pictus]|uniref:uncharacterized protein LOC135153857 n=1 Tax=Lytechinus pictus TaxID=7653 RepID=UPI0030B9D703